MKKALLLFISAFLSTMSAYAAAPVCMYQDVQSGPASGGEGGNGVYLNIYGVNFGATQGSSTVAINGTPVAQYLYWGADPTGERQQIGVQIAMRHHQRQDHRDYRRRIMFESKLHGARGAHLVYRTECRQFCSRHCG
jgi:hypothetical protein